MKFFRADFLLFVLRNKLPFQVSYNWFVPFCNDYILRNNIDVSRLFSAARRRQWPGNVSVKNIKTENTEFDEDSPIFGNMFVFTGVLEKMTRRDAMQIVVDRGGLCGDGITKKTNFLILGNSEYCAVLRGAKSSKQKKAESMILAGYDIEIISEDVFYEMISM